MELIQMQAGEDFHRDEPFSKQDHERYKRRIGEFSSDAEGKKAKEDAQKKAQMKADKAKLKNLNDLKK